jgi:hypothetical protein
MGQLVRFKLDDRQYEELAFAGRSQGNDPNQEAKFAVQFFLMYLKHSAMQVHLNNPDEFEEKAAETFNTIFGMKIIDEEKKKEDAVK